MTGPASDPAPGGPGGPLLTLLGAYARLSRRLVQPLIDRILGVDTYLEDEPPPPPGSDRVEYVASGWRNLRVSFRHLRADGIGPGDVLLDVGCGKGRPLLVGARAGFHRVLGIEASPRLAAIARANLAARSIAGEIVTGSVEDWEVPDEVTVAYLFDPFGARTMAAFAAALERSLGRRPRCFRVVYRQPRQAALLCAAGFVPRATWTSRLGRLPTTLYVREPP